MKCFKSVRAAVLQILRSMLVPNNVKAIDDKEKKEKKNKWMIYFTGHSMGGCLAALCAFEIGRIRAGAYVIHDDDVTSLSVKECSHILMRFIMCHTDSFTLNIFCLPSYYRAL